MTREATRQKQKKKRALKRKHEHLTEQISEEKAKRKRTHAEEFVAIIVLVFFAGFMVIGVALWPATVSETEGYTGLPDGEYDATFLDSRPATDSHPAAAALQVGGLSVAVSEGDLSGEAAQDSTAFFELDQNESIQITVKNGSITEWKALD